jgi:hypothetical protein
VDLKKFESTGRTDPDDMTRTPIVLLKQLRNRLCDRAKTNEIVRDVLGTNRGEYTDDEDDCDEYVGSRGQISKKRFFNPLQSESGINDYATRIGNWLAFLVHLKQSGYATIE